MLTYSFENIDTESMYEHLYRCIKQDILQKKLRAGEKLPSKRTFAKNLGVSTITVESAYAQLVAEGFLYTLPKRGYYVCELEREEPVAPLPPRPKGPAPREPDKRAYWADFVGSSVARDMFPFSVWVKLLRDVTAGEDEATLLTDTSAGGIRQLRQAISDHLYQFRGMTIDPEQIVVGAGSETLIGLLVQLLGREGGYGVENPGYTKTQRILTSCGAAVRPLPLDGQGLRVDALEEAGVRVVHVTPSHHYPLGIIMPVARRQALLRWAEAAPDRYILEDDYDSEFRFSGRPIPALQSLDGGERVVYLNTFAKSLAPSLRISYMVLPPHLLERWRRDFWFYSSTVPSFEQYALARFMERGHFERHLNRTRTRYKARREALLAAARDTGLTRVGSFAGGDAGLHLLLWMDGRWSEAELVARAVDAGVGVAPLSACDLTPPPPGRPPALILGYTRIAAVDMAPALRRLKAAWAF